MIKYPTPNNLSDIVTKRDEYLEFIRANPNDGLNFIDYLSKYVSSTFDSILHEDDVIIKKMAITLIDELYIQNIKLTQLDKFTHAYFGILISHLFFCLSKRNIYLFYILDNKLRDDRFKLHVDLCKEAGLSVIYPYECTELIHTTNFTILPCKNLESVQTEITKAIYEKKHIIYVEKDDSINYLSNILRLAEDHQNKYVCIFRNKDIHHSPQWLLGSFGEIIENS